MVHGASKKRIVDGEAETSSEQVRDPDSEASEDSRLGSKDSKVSSERPELSVPRSQQSAECIAIRFDKPTIATREHGTSKRTRLRCRHASPIRHSEDSQNIRTQRIRSAP